MANQCIVYKTFRNKFILDEKPSTASMVRRRTRTSTRRRGYRRRRGSRRSYRRNKRPYKYSFRSTSSRISLRRKSTSILQQNSADAAGTPFLSAVQFVLTDIVEYLKLISVFQQFRINCVVVTLTPNNDSNNYTTSNPTNMPIIGWVTDYEDAATPPDATALRSFSNYKETRFNRPISVKIYPRISVDIFNSGSAGYLVPPAKQWINSKYATAPHYGFKYCVYNFAAAQRIYWRISYTMYASFKQPGNYNL